MGVLVSEGRAVEGRMLRGVGEHRVLEAEMRAWGVGEGQGGRRRG